jgi:hypothetical protein
MMRRMRRIVRMMRVRVKAIDMMEMERSANVCMDREAMIQVYCIFLCGACI